MSYISRYDINGKSIANEIFHRVENGSIRITAKIISDGRRLDHYAQEYYDNGMNYWIIAAASGIRWPFAIGSGTMNLPDNLNSNIVLYIPDVEDIIKLKDRVL